MLRWARDHGCPWGPETTAAAACGGHALILAYAVANGCPMHDNMCEYAAYGGDVFMLEGLRQQGYYLGNKTSAYAAEAGQLKMLMYLQTLDEQQFSEDTSERAAFSGHLGILIWLRENGCPWSWRARLAAEQDGHHRLCKWAEDNGCPPRCKQERAWAYNQFVLTASIGWEPDIMPLVCPTTGGSPAVSLFMSMQLDILLD